MTVHTLALHDALPISAAARPLAAGPGSAPLRPRHEPGEGGCRQHLPQPVAPAQPGAEVPPLQQDPDLRQPGGARPVLSALSALWRGREDRQSTRLNSSTNAHLVCRLLLEQKKA